MNTDGIIRFFDLERPESLVLIGKTAAGAQVTFQLTGQDARCACHEIDHLNGILVIDRAREQTAGLPRQQRRAVERQLAKIGG